MATGLTARTPQMATGITPPPRVIEDKRPTSRSKGKKPVTKKKHSTETIRRGKSGRKVAKTTARNARSKTKGTGKPVRTTAVKLFPPPK